MKAETCLVWSAEITDLERLAAAQADARMEHCRTEAGPFRMSMRAVDFGPVRVQSNSASNGYLGRGVLRPDRYGLLFLTGGPSGASRVNGFAAEEDDIILARPGAEALAHTRPGQAWALLLLDRETFGMGFETGWPGGAESLLASGLLRAAPGIRRLAVEVGELVAAGPGRLHGAAVAGSMVEAFAANIGAAFAAGPVRPGRARRQYVRAAAVTVDFLDSVLGRPVYSQDVAQAVGVSTRFLNEAFAAVYGISLHRYLHIRRLNLARRRLLGAAEDTLVKTIAIDLGFWHLGRFARAYRELFGEMPSETRPGGRGDRGAVPMPALTIP